MPAPSPITKPSRSLSKGREAFSGSSLRVESARIAQKPPTPSGVIAASEPPAIMTSASPRWMRRKESPTAWAPLAHAVAVAEFGPLAPVRIETQPEARLTIAAGMKNGLILRGPALEEGLVLALDGGEAADAAADEDAHPSGLGTGPRRTRRPSSRCRRPRSRTG